MKRRFNFAVKKFLSVFLTVLLVLGSLALVSSFAGMTFPWFQSDEEPSDIEGLTPSEKEEEVTPGTDNMENGGQSGVDWNDPEDNMDPDGWIEVKPDESKDLGDTPFYELSW